MPHHHGDWKQLFRAAGEGNVDEMAYHIVHGGGGGGGVDVNFQHPEYMSSVLCEASRAGQVAAVQYLLAHGADPYQPEYYSDQLPLQLALQERRHDVVDILLAAMQRRMPDDVDDEDDNPTTAAPTTTAKQTNALKTNTTATTTTTMTKNIVQTIWLDTHDDALVAAVAHTGHCVVWPTPATTILSSSTDNSYADTRLARIRDLTGNRKIVLSWDHPYGMVPPRTRTKTSVFPGNNSSSSTNDDSVPMVDVAFVDNRMNDNNNDHSYYDDDGHGAILNRLLRLVLGLRLRVQNDHPNNSAAEATCRQGTDQQQQQQKYFLPIKAKRVILAQRPASLSELPTTIWPQDMTPSDGVGVPTDRLVYEVVVAPPQQQSWWYRSVSLLVSHLVALVVVVVDGGGPNTTMFPSSSFFVEAALSAIFPVPPRQTSHDDNIEF